MFYLLTSWINYFELKMSIICSPNTFVVSLYVPSCDSAGKGRDTLVLIEVNLIEPHIITEFSTHCLSVIHPSLTPCPPFAHPPSPEHLSAVYPPPLTLAADLQMSPQALLTNSL